MERANTFYRRMFKTASELLRSLFAEFIYRYENGGQSAQAFLEDVKEREALSEDELERLSKLIEYYMKNEDEMYDQLKKTLVGWRPERLLPLDRAAILAGMVELLREEDDVDRIIYDYGTFARRFSSERSPSFVMGVLRSFKNRMRDEKE